MVETVKITPTLFKAQAGAFRSIYRYLRKSTAGGAWYISGGLTIKHNHLILNPGGGNESIKFAWRIRIGDLVNYTKNEDPTNAPNLNAPNFTSQAQQVKI